MSSNELSPLSGSPVQAAQERGTVVSRPSSLVDVLERVLDKGIVIAGDIQINLLEIELLTIKLRLLIASVDRAREMGIDWWERDASLSSPAGDLEDENRSLRERLERLEQAAGLPAPDDGESQRQGSGEQQGSGQQQGSSERQWQGRQRRPTKL